MNRNALFPHVLAGLTALAASAVAAPAPAHVEPLDIPHEALLDMAADLGLTVRGLSFHVGSQVSDPGKYVEAITACRDLMADAGARGFRNLDCLDIGGGFPVAYRRDPLPIARFCQPIRRALARLPLFPGVPRP